MSSEDCVSNHTSVREVTFFSGEMYLTVRSGRVNTDTVNSYRGRNIKRLEKRTGLNIMKKITSVLLGLSLTLATAGLSLAAQTAAAPADNSTPVAKKHVKKNKKTTKSTAATPVTPATVAPTAK